MNDITNYDCLPFVSGTSDFHFRMLNIFLLNGTEISSKPILYPEFLYNWGFLSRGSTVFSSANL